MKQDDFWASIVFAGLTGAALAAPKLQDTQELQQFRNNRSQLQLRVQKIGDLSILEKLRQKPSMYNLFVESCNMFVNEFFRGASVFSIAIIEHLLKEKYSENNFKKLIDKAKEDNLIKSVEEHYLNGLRMDRNSLIHDSERQINENESLMIIHLAIRIMTKLL